MAYLQPGVSVVWPGGWHLALASFGPPPLLPGPNDGSASAAGASAPSTPRVVSATAMRFFILSLQQELCTKRVDARHDPTSAKTAIGNFFAFYRCTVSQNLVQCATGRLASPAPPTC